MQVIPIKRLEKLVPEVDSRNWVYPQKISGRFTNARHWLGAGLILLFAALPFIRINDMPAILFDVPNRRFVLFGEVFWPHDVAIIFFLAFAFFVLILFVTALAGRVWCGYACPQTVYLHTVFLTIEHWIEGDRNQQMRLDQSPWTRKKLGKKLLKHGLFLLFSSVVAHIFLAYFMDVRQLSYAILHPSWDYKAPIIFATFITVAFYVDFAFLREQFCNYVCPYARFQSALLDRDSWIVAYDENRGEPRANAKERTDASGDCIACTKCVVVCPQGIDIREGLQLECIHCARCIDACDSVMDKIGKPRGLIRYASENELEEGRKIRPFRGRTVVYGLLLIGSLSMFAIQLSSRQLIEATLLRPPGAVYQELASGELANHFRIQLINKGAEDSNYVLALMNPPGWRLIAPTNPVPMAGGEERAVEVFVVAPQNYRGSDQKFEIAVTDGKRKERIDLSGTAVVPR